MAGIGMRPCHGLKLGPYLLPPTDEDAPFLQKLWPKVLMAVHAGRTLRVDADILETLLDGCPRDCLNLRDKREELASAIKPLLETGDDVSEATAELISSALDYHDQILEDNCGLCRLGKFHNILYVMVALAVEFNVQDTYVIIRLLEAIHRCEGGLDRIVLPAVVGPKITYMVCAWKPETDTAEEARYHLKFFLIHAMKSKLAFPSRDETQLYRMIDAPIINMQCASPLYVAVQNNDEDAVLFLLQHGANPVVGGQLCPFTSVLMRLSNCARDTISYRPKCGCKYGQCPCELARPIPYPEVAVSVFRILLRAIAIPILIYNGHPLEVLQFLVHPRLYCDKLLSKEPPSLRHFSRVVVRDTLNKNWALPHGTHSLELPESLVKYVNLQT
ncbi:unnamed protein product [Meganyctiphanes norvegica]|uniref:Ankyrin repeat and SOCS box protein 17 n=1 Tax=Meganyctiphanes norvegica TaxID=48144 RepID=A0AAV2QVG8_MEGNR